MGGVLLQCVGSFTHAVTKDWLSTSCVKGTVSGTGDKREEDRHSPGPLGAYRQILTNDNKFTTVESRPVDKVTGCYDSIWGEGGRGHCCPLFLGGRWEWTSVNCQSFKTHAEAFSLPNHSYFPLLSVSPLHEVRLFGFGEVGREYTSPLVTSESQLSSPDTRSEGWFPGLGLGLSDIFLLSSLHFQNAENPTPQLFLPTSKIVINFTPFIHHSFIRCFLSVPVSSSSIFSAIFPALYPLPLY